MAGGLTNKLAATWDALVGGVNAVAQDALMGRINAVEFGEWVDEAAENETLKERFHVRGELLDNAYERIQHLVNENSALLAENSALRITLDAERDMNERLNARLDELSATHNGYRDNVQEWAEAKGRIVP